MRPEAFLGIDIGTSGCKAVLMAPDGSVLAAADASYELQIPRDGWAEQRPEDWVTGAAQAVRKACGDCDAEIRCVGLTGQMHGMVALDTNSKVMRPAILWNDQRNQSECDEITEIAGGEQALLELTGNRMLLGFTGGKIRWFAKNEPKLFAQTRLILNPKDYVRYRMTSEPATDVSDASGTGLFDAARRKWSDALLDRIEIDRKLLPACCESTEIAGRVSAAGADLFGLPAGTPVVAGGGDAVVQTLGAGVADPGRLQTTIGTAGIVAAALDAPLDKPDGRLQLSCSIAADRWHCMGVTLNAGGALAWLRSALHSSSGSAPDYAAMLAQAAQIAPGADGLLFVPYLMGERCPHADPHARGAFVGLRAQHTGAHLVRSALEGIVFALRDIAAVMHEVGAPDASMVLASGGGAGSQLWNQIQADIFGTQVAATGRAAEGGACGAALLAGIGIGNWSTAHEAAQTCRITQRWEPDSARSDAYSELFAVYRTLHGQLREANTALSGFAARAQ